MASLSDNSVTSHPSCRESARGHGWVASAEGEAPPRRRPLARCGGLLPSASADVRSSDDVTSCEGWWVGKSHRTHLSGIFPGTYAGALYLCLKTCDCIYVVAVLNCILALTCIVWHLLGHTRAWRCQGHVEHPLLQQQHGHGHGHGHVHERAHPMQLFAASEAALPSSAADDGSSTAATARGTGGRNSPDGGVIRPALTAGSEPWQDVDAASILAELDSVLRGASEVNFEHDHCSTAPPPAPTPPPPPTAPWHGVAIGPTEAKNLAVLSHAKMLLAAAVDPLFGELVFDLTQLLEQPLTIAASPLKPRQVWNPCNRAVLEVYARRH